MFANSRDQRSGMGMKWGTSFAKDRVQGPRFDEKGLFGVQKMEHDELQNSRNLWVGNVSQHVTETVLAEQFSRFGEVESITVYSSRNYAFVNFRKEEDAVIAKRSLQGLVLGGLALRIEFAKGDSHPSSIQHADDLTRFRDERRLSDMAGLSGTRDSRVLGPNSEASFSEKHKGDKNAEPSEVLWIGFPAYMKVDEISLRRVFSPFGEIEHVTTFPGRTYAFVQFRSVVAACRAKEALQGKLFNNPRVNICFSKSEVGPVEHGRNLTNGSLPFSHKAISNSGVGSKAVENVREERHQGMTSGGLCLPSASFGSNTDRMLSSSNANLISRANSVRAMSAVSKIGSAYDDIRATRIGSEMGVAKEVSDLPMNSPRVERSSFWRINGLDKSRGGGPYYEDMWDSSSDDVSSRDVKRPRFAPVSRSDSSDLPFSEQDRDMQHFCSPRTGAMNPGSESFKFSRFSVGSDIDVGASHCSDNLISENTRHPNRPSQQLDGPWNVPNNFESGIVSTIPPPLDSGKWDGSVSETHHGPLNEEWKWQGTIAKGGTPVCRARCFPVGKVLDVTLPEFLNCTARTGLDMLATHFNKAGSVGVVFFVPESDPDIVPYNEFMHYLEEKQRAAVTKLGEGTTLFLVPPSQFSEQVLKVPGKVSISGVILKFDQPNSGHGLPHHPSSELVNAQPHPFLHRPSVPNGIPMHEDSTHSKPPSPLPPQQYAGHGNANFYTEHYQAPNTSFSPVQSLPPTAVPVVYQAHGSGTSPSSSSFEVNMNATVVNDNMHHNFSPQSQVPASPWSTLNQDRSHVPNSREVTYASDSSSFIMPSQPGFSSTQQGVTVQQQPSFTLAPNPEQQSVGVANNPTIAGPSDQNQHLRRPMPPVPGDISLQSGHLAQLANLLGQQSQSAQLSVTQSLQENQQKPPPPTPQTAPNFCSVPQTNFHIQPNVPLPLPSSQFSYGQQAQQQTSQQGMLPRTGNLSDVRIVESLVPDNQKQNDGREETETDPQKRLQATLQLAAALLQQIQQQSKGGDQQ